MNNQRRKQLQDIKSQLETVRDEVKPQPRVRIGCRYQPPVRQEFDRDAILLQQALLRDPQTSWTAGVINTAGAASVLLLPIILWLLG